MGFAHGHRADSLVIHQLSVPSRAPTHVHAVLLSFSRHRDSSPPPPPPQPSTSFQNILKALLYILSYLPSKTMGCFSGRLMSSARDQKLFCEICSVFDCSFDEFVGEKVVSPSYSSAILAPPPESTSLKMPSLFIPVESD